MDLGEIGCYAGVDSVHLIQDRNQPLAVGHTVMTLRVTKKAGCFVDWLSDC